MKIYNVAGDSAERTKHFNKKDSVKNCGFVKASATFLTGLFALVVCICAGILVQNSTPKNGSNPLFCNLSEVSRGALKDLTAFSSANSGLHSTKNSSTDNNLSNIADGGIFVLPEILTGTILGQNLKVAPSKDNSTSAGLVHDDDDINYSGLINNPDDLNFVATSTTQTITEDITLNQNTTISQTWVYPDQDTATTYTLDLMGFNLVADSSLRNGLMFSIGKNVTLEIKNSSSDVSSVYSEVSIQMFQISGQLIVNATNSNIIFDGKEQGSKMLILAYKLKNSEYSVPSATLNGCIVHQFYSHAMQVNAGAELVLNGATIENNKGTASILSYDSASSTDCNPPIVTINAATTFNNNLRGSINSDLYVKGYCTLTIAEGVSLAKRVPTKIMKNQEIYTYTENTVEEYVDIYTQGSLTTTIDLNGFTISNIDDSKASTFDISGSVIIKNGNIKLNDNAFAFITDTSGTNTTIKDIKVTSKNENGSLSYSSFYTSSISKTTTFENVEIDGGYTTQVNVYGTNLVFKGCKFKDIQTSSGVISCNSTVSTIEIDESTVFENNLKRNTDGKRLDIVTRNNATLNIAGGVTVYIDDCKSTADMNTIIELSATTKTVEYGSGGRFVPTGTDGNENTITDNYTVKYRVSGGSGEWSTSIPTTLGIYDVYLYRAKTSTNSTLSRMLSGAFVVEPQKVAVPTLSATTFTYNGGVQKPILSEYDSSILTETFENFSSTNAGTYKITFALADKTNYCWADGTTADKEVSYTITKATNQITSLTFDGWEYGGTPSTPQIDAKFGKENVTYTYKNGSTTLSSLNNLNAGTYTITATISATDNYTEATLTKNFEVSKIKLAKPTVVGDSEFTYDDTEKSLIFDGLDETKMTVGENSQTNAGSYSVTIALKDTTNYCWADNTITDLRYGLKINRAKVTSPTIDSKVYTGGILTADIPTSVFYTVLRNNGGTNVKSYDVYLELKDRANYDWSTRTSGVDAPSDDNGTLDDYIDAGYDDQDLLSLGIARLTFTITKATTNNITISCSDFTYGSYTELNKITASADFGTPTVVIKNSSGTIITDISKASAGTYTITATVEDTDNYVGGTKTATITIAKIKLTKPTASITTFTYNGSVQKPSITSFSESTMAVNYSNDESKNAGTYTATISLIDATNYQWDDETDGNVIINYTISKVKVAQSDLPTLTTNTFVFDNTDHTVTFKNEKSYLSVTGTKTAKNVDSYTLTILISDPTNYEFATGVINTLTWDITKGVNTWNITPTIAGWVYGEYSETLNASKGVSKWGTVSFTYRKKETTETISLENIKTSDVGNYELIATVLADGNNYDQIQEIVEFAISKKELTKPTLKTPTSVTYNTEEHSFTLNGFNEGTMTKLGDNLTQTNAGSYSVTIALQNTTNYCWTGGGVENFDLTFEILPAKLNKPTVVGDNTFTYDGDLKTLNLTGFDASTMTKSGDSKTVAGSYTATISLIDNTNYQWADGNTTNVEISWSIAKATATVPTKVDKNYTYTGADQTLDLNNFNSTLMNITGNVGKDAKIYTAVVTLKDPDNYKWATDFDGNISWGIGQATNSFTQTIVTGWSGDEDPKVPTITAKFGEVILTYKVVGSDTESATIPSAVGSYKVVARVTETINYTGLEQEFDLNITSKSNSITGLTITGWTYGDYDAETNEPSATAKEGAIKYYYVGVGDTNYAQSEVVPTDAGTYKVLAIVTGTSEYAGANADCPFVIEKASVRELDKPTIVGNYTYNQNPQTVQITAVPTYMTLGGSLSGEDAKEYTIIITLDDNHKWAEGVSNTIVWTIQKGQSVINSLTIANWTYKDIVKTPVISTNFEGCIVKYYYEGAGYEKSEIAPQNAGTYTLTAEIIETDNYNGVTSDGVTFTISPKTVTAPSENTNTFTYTGSSFTYLANGTDYTVSNGTKTEAGSYDVTITLNDKSNFVWSTGGTEDISFTFIINKAEFTIPSAGAKQYTGETLKSDLVNTADYLVIQNNGGEGIGEYDVILKLSDEKFKNYKWAGQNDDVQQITIKFNIVGTTNDWKTNPTIEGFEYNSFNDTINAPKGEALFGDVTFKFFIEGADGNKTGEALTLEQVKTADAGNYIMVATVPADGGVYDELTKEVKFVISKKKLTAPTKTSKTYTYIKNTSQTLELDENFDASIIDISDNTGMNATGYTAIITIAEAHQKNYEWNGGETQIEINWEILKQKLTIPTVNETQNLTYTGREISLTLDNFHGDLMDVAGNTGTNVSATGYTATVTLKDSVNYEWDGTFDGNIAWNIQKAQAEITNLTILDWAYGSDSVNPSSSTNFGTINYTYEGVDGTNYPASSSVPTRAGKYKVIAKVSGSDNWNEAIEKTQIFEIFKKQISKPIEDTTNFVFNGEAQTYQIASSEYYTISNNTTQTNAGSQTVTISLKDTDNYIWEGTDSASVLTYTFTIGKLKVTAPAENTATFIYTGTEQIYMVDGEYYSVANGKRTDAGSQTVTISLKDTDNTEWADGGINAIYYTFTISKAEVKISEITTEITEGTSGEFSISDGLLPENVGVKIEYAPTGTEDWSETVPQAVGSYDVRLTFTVSSESINFISSEQIIQTGFVIKAKSQEPSTNQTPSTNEAPTNEDKDSGLLISIIILVVEFSLITLFSVIFGLSHRYYKKKTEELVREYYIIHPDEAPENFLNEESDTKKKKKKSK